MDNELMLDVGQANELKLAFRRAGWTNADIKKLTEGNLAEQCLLVIKGLATIVRICLKLALDKDFSPAEFIGGNWSTWRGPADGDGINGDEDYVPEPDVVDFEQIVLEKDDAHGEEKMRRCRASKNRQLGGKAFLALWNDWQACKATGKPEDSILERLRRSGKIRNVIYFFGQTLRYSGGVRCVLCLCFGGREWGWYCSWLVCHWNAEFPSVALASVETQP